MTPKISPDDQDAATTAAKALDAMTVAIGDHLPIFTASYSKFLDNAKTGTQVPEQLVQAMLIAPIALLMASATVISIQAEPRTLERLHNVIEHGKTSGRDAIITELCNIIQTIAHQPEIEPVGDGSDTRVH